MIRAVSSTPFPCQLATRCIVCGHWIGVGQWMVLVMPQHAGSHHYHPEVR